MLRRRIYFVIGALVLLYIFFPEKVKAEEEETRKFLVTVSTAKYSLIDSLKKQRSYQDWEVTTTTDGGTFYRIKKKETESQQIILDEIENYFQKLSHSPGRSFYFKESLTYHPMTLKRSGSFIGRIEVRDIKEDTVIDAWPVTGTVVVNGGVHTTTITATIPSFGRTVITRIYKEGEYHLPLFERQEIYKNKKPEPDSPNNTFFLGEEKTQDLLYSKQ